MIVNRETALGVVLKSRWECRRGVEAIYSSGVLQKVEVPPPEEGRRVRKVLFLLLLSTTSALPCPALPDPPRRSIFTVTVLNWLGQLWTLVLPSLVLSVCPSSIFVIHGNVRLLERTLVFSEVMNDLVPRVDVLSILDWRSIFEFVDASSIPPEEFLFFILMRAGGWLKVVQPPLARWSTTFLDFKKMLFYS